LFGVTLAADFVPIWKTLIGQTVQITGGRVYGARLDSALLSVPGWQHRPFPAFLPRRAALHPRALRRLSGGPCEMSVTGKLRPHFGNGPELVNVTFHIPNPYGLLDRTRFSERR
jgi:hypothetical protein